jgi:pimeloyl-ACP methyl ester carboxylesterase
MQKMACRIPHGRYITIPDAGHDLHLEQPDTWRQVAEEFLRALETGGND